MRNTSLFFICLLFAAAFTLPTAFASAVPLTGHTWSSNVGWIKWSGQATDGSPYGVSVDSITGALSGYAWSSNVGWLSFNRRDTGAVPSGEFLEANLPGWWRFEEGAGDVAANSGTVGPFFGTLIGGARWSEGIDGGALGFDGVDDYVSVTSSNPFSFPQLLISPDVLSIAAWVKPEAGYGSGTNPGVISHRGAWGEIFIEQASGKLWARIYQSGGSFRNLPLSPNPLPEGVWSHIALVTHPSDLINPTSVVRLYVDGELVSSIPYNGTLQRTSSHPLVFGRASSTPSFFKGSIDEVRLYKRTITDAELRAYYIETAPFRNAIGYWHFGEDRIDTDLKLAGRWKLDEGSGAVMTDVSGNGNHGIVSGASWTAGKYGAGLAFDGVSNRALVAPAPSLDSPSFSIAMWVKPLAINGSNPNLNLLATREDYLISGFRLGIGDAVGGGSGGAISLWTVESGGTLAISSGNNVLPTGVFSHVAVTYNANSKLSSIYINGVLVGVGTGSFVPPTSKTLIFGASAGFGGSNSVLDDIRLYGRAITPSEVLAISELVHDASGGGNFGTTFGGMAQGGEGIRKNGLQFDGADDYVEGNNQGSATFDVNPGEAKTITAWFKAKPQRNEGFMVWKSWSCVGWGLSLTPGGSIRMNFTTSDNFCSGSLGLYNILADDVRYDDNRWHHVAAVIDRPNQVMKVYVDGVEKGSRIIDNVLSGAAGDSKFRFGMNWEDPSLAPRYTGFLDEIGIFNRALDAPELQSLASVGDRPISRLTTAELEGWGRFLATTAGWDGWVSFKSPRHNVRRDGTGFKGFAWGDEVVGWISFCGGLKKPDCPGAIPYGIAIGTIDPAFRVELAADPVSGAPPLDGVDLKARVFFSNPPGPLTLRFYCDIGGPVSRTTSSLDVTIPRNNPVVMTDLCRYTQVGTYTPRVIAERPGVLGMTAEDTAQVTVVEPQSFFGDPVTGYAWSSNIGWISFSGTADNGTPYGVFADSRDGALSGFAWNGNAYAKTVATIIGDLDESGRVDGFDLALLASAQGAQPGDPRWRDDYDLNNDGVINITDNDILGIYFGRSSPPRTINATSGVGWISFGPRGPYPSTPNFSARFTGQNLDKLTGWARACSAYTGDCNSGAVRPGLDATPSTGLPDRWNGWLKLSGTTTGAVITEPFWRISTHGITGDFPEHLASDHQGTTWVLNGTAPFKISKTSSRGVETTYPVNLTWPNGTLWQLTNPTDFLFDYTDPSRPSLLIADYGDASCNLAVRPNTCGGVWRISLTGTILDGPILPGSRPINIEIEATASAEPQNNYLWVLDGTLAVRRIEMRGLPPLTGISAGISVPAFFGVHLLYFVQDSGMMWIVHGAGTASFISRINPAVGIEATYALSPGARQAKYITYDGEAFWLSGAGGLFTRVLPTGEAVDFKFTSGFAPIISSDKLAVDLWDGFLWIKNAGSKVYRVNPGTSKAVDTFPSAAGTFLKNVQDIAFDGFSVVTADADGDTVSRMQSLYPPGEPHYEMRIFPAPEDPQDIAFDAAGNAWVVSGNIGTDNTRISRIAEDGTVTTYTTINQLGDPRAIIFDGTDFWVAVGPSENFRGGVYKMNPSRRSIIPGLGPFGPANPFAMAFDGTSVWVVDGTNVVRRLRLNGTPQFSVTLAPDVRAIDITVDNLGNVWTANEVAAADGGYTRINQAGGETSWRGIGRRPRAIGFDRAHSHVWISHGGVWYTKIALSGTRETRAYQGLGGGPIAFDDQGNMWTSPGEVLHRIPLPYPSARGERFAGFSRITRRVAYNPIKKSVWTVSGADNTVNMVTFVTPPGIIQPYEVTRNIGKKRLEGLAWGGDQIGWISFCDVVGNTHCVNLTLDPLNAVTLKAIPSFGIRPLNDVDLKVTVQSDSTIFPFRYEFDCDINDLSDAPELAVASTTANPYTAADLCDYPATGTYTAQVTVEQGGVSRAATTRVIAFPGGLIECPPGSATCPR